MNNLICIISVNLMDMIPDLLHLDFLTVLAVILALIAWSPKRLYTIWILKKKLDAREALPSRISDFPTHDTSLEKYLDVKRRIDDFRNCVLTGESSQISLSASDLNDVYLQGSNIDKYRVDVFALPYMRYDNKFLFFEIIDDRILKKELEYISIDGLSVWA
jgi:hypothetical protein